jgi:hypothetical protein
LFLTSAPHLSFSRETYQQELRLFFSIAKEVTFYPESQLANLSCERDLARHLHLRVKSHSVWTLL